MRYCMQHRGTRDRRALKWSGATLPPAPRRRAARPDQPQTAQRPRRRQASSRPARIASAVRATRREVQATLWIVTSRAAVSSPTWSRWRR